MGERVTVECKLTTDLSDEAYRNPDDKWTNALLLTTQTFDELDVDLFTYVRAKSAEASHEESMGTILYAIPLSEEVYSEYEGANDIGALRSNLMRKIEPNLQPGDRIDLEAVEHVSFDGFEVADSFADEITGEICYLHPSRLDQLGVETEGETVEAYNPETGSRMLLSAWETHIPVEGTDVISIDGYSRTILGTELGGEVNVREVVNERSRSWNPLVRIRDTLLRVFVDRRQISLAVESGLYRDEHRNIARVREDVLEFLGIDPGDRIVVSFKGKSMSVQCFPPPEDEEVEPLSIRLPSTSRDIVEVCLGDGIRVSRDMGYVFKKQASLSAIGIIGIVLSTITLIDIPLSEYPTAILNHPVVSAAAFVVFIFISAVLVWFILYPERQRCTEFGTPKLP